MAKRERKKQELKVELTVTYVPLPDEAATDRWLKSMVLFLKLLDRPINQEQGAGKSSLGGGHKSESTLP
jgi:hypothetical protein